MAYRRTERIQQRLNARHAALIGAARDLAAEQGMNAVQVAPVAERAGIAAGTVYRYFPSKTALVEAVVGGVRDAELQALRDAASAAPGPLSALASAIVTFAVRARRQRRLIWAVVAEPVDADVNEARLAFRRALTDEIATRLAAAHAGAQPLDVEPAIAAPAVVGALMEALIGPLAPTGDADPAHERTTIQGAALVALRAVGIVDARARGLVVQTPWPAETAATVVSAT